MFEAIKTQIDYMKLIQNLQPLLKKIAVEVVKKDLNLVPIIVDDRLMYIDDKKYKRFTRKQQNYIKARVREDIKRMIRGEESLYVESAEYEV